MKNKYLLELGTEEIPARFVENSLKQLKEKWSKLLEEERINYEEIKTYATPRRLVVLIEGLSDKQKDLEELVKGPSEKIAYDNDGHPTKALIGFAKSQGISLDSIVVRQYKGEKYIYANKVAEGRKVQEVIKDKARSIITSISFPKSMRWGGNNFRFSRPIRWIVSLFNDEIVEFEIGNIKVSNKTKGHRFLGSSEIVVNNVDEYFQKLKDNYVIVDQNERKEIIKRNCEKLAREKGGNLLKDDELLNELTYIVEYPTPMIGRINEEFLSLPKEVIITPMKEHQRYFPVLDDKGRLLPYFIAVRNGNEEYLDIVTKGNEKVLEARLEDAKFFYNEDIKQPLEQYVERLKSIVFQEKLGTMYEKTIRINELSRRIGEYLEVGEETLNNMKRASLLSKADLVTNMVNEFTELQGIMGREYAIKSGENEITSLAIFEHYLPRFAGDELPTTTAGAILSIADKLDTIAGCFAIGIKPTGSQDPYGLRRQALGIINIILDKNLKLSLNELLDFALYIYVEEKGLAFDYNRVKNDIKEFFDGRIKSMFIEIGIRYDIVDAVLTSDVDDIVDLKLRAEKLNEWINKEGFNEILTAFNRVITLASKCEEYNVNKEIFKEEQERKLYEVYNDIEEKVIASINRKEYDKALDEMLILKKPIDSFFDNVMVMVENEELKNNRLALLKKISDLMLRICDLSKIVNS